MPSISKDLRLVDGDISTISKAIINYLRSENFKIDKQEPTENGMEIIGSNLQQSFFKLFLSGSPQVVKWHIIKKSEEQAQLETASNLFKKFRSICNRIIFFLLLYSLIFLAAGCE